MEESIGALRSEVSRLSDEVTTLRKFAERRRHRPAIAFTLGVFAAFLGGHLSTVGHAAKGVEAVYAPFVVLGSDDKPILRVDEKLASGGSGGARVTIAGGDKSNFGIRFFNAGGKMVAAVGESQAGAGLVVISSSDGDRRAAMSTHEGKGDVSVIGESGNAVITLAQGASGGGKLEISNAGGALRVEAGVAPLDVGVVRTGPAAFASSFGGFPISVIRGAKK
jgi:hypothetical protein